MATQIRLTENELREHIAKYITEALEDEGMMDFLRGAGKKIGGDIANGAKSAWNKGKQAAQTAATNVKNYANSVKQSGQMSSMNADNQKIADQLQDWYNSGVFGNSRQASSWISGLINCLNKNFSGRFGQNGSAMRR